MSGSLRIGELARRAEVSPELLRAWERRYGLLSPERSEGGFRLYSAADEARVRAMKAHIASGLSAAEAARVVLAEEPPAPETGHDPAEPALELEQERDALAEALAAYDQTRADAVVDGLLTAASLDTVLAQVVLPLLHDVGERWEKSELTVGQEHFASHVIRGRLIALARGWDQGAGPRAVLACAPEEGHDLALVCHGLALRARGWRISYLGAHTPVQTLIDTVQTIGPDAVVIAAHLPGRLEPHVSELRRLAGIVLLAIGGAGTDPALADSLGALHLPDGPVESADVLARHAAEAR